MDADLGARAFIILKCYIDARDERGNSLFGTVLGVASRREVKYLSVMFSRDETSKSMGWRELLLTHRNNAGAGDRNPALVHHEEELFNYIQRSTILNNVAKNHNTKQAEQSISRYCMENLQLKAVSLVEYFEAGEDDLHQFERRGGAPQASPGGEPGDAIPQPEVDEDGGGEPDDEAKERDGLVVRCEPILDPVGGVAMNELGIGEAVMARLPENSVFFKLLSRNIRGFDGVVSASVTGILQNELGTATVSLALSDGITGVMKLSGKVRIKTAQPPETRGETGGAGPGEIPPGLIVGAAVAIVVIAAIVAMYYIIK
jgi:hypothetical protein